VSFERIIDGLNVGRETPIDARVQIADGVSVTDEAFARSAVLLADALARGDDEALTGMLTRPAVEDLDLVLDHGWDEATEDIEAVRIVYAGPFEGAIVSQAAEQLAAAGLEDAQAQMKEMMEKMGDAMGEGMGDMLKQAMEQVKNMTPEELQKMRDEAAAAGATEEQLAQMDAGIKALQEGGEIPDLTAQMGAALGGDNGVLLAIQEPNASYVLGWAGQSAGGDWLFTNVPSTGEVRARASEWDGVGAAGFEYDLSLATVTPTSTEYVAPDDAPDEPAEDGSSDAPKPKQQNTPHGPVTIPGG
jgi:hypothetical protein